MGRIDEAIAKRQRGLITRKQAWASGVTDSGIDHRVATGQWVRVCKSVFLTTGRTPDLLTLTAAAGLATDGAATGDCGAWVWELDDFREPSVIRVVAPTRHRIHDFALELSEAEWLRPEHITRRRGVPVLQPAHLLLYLGEHVSRDQVEWALDCCLRRRFTTWEALHALAHAPEAKNRAGPALLRELLELRSQRQHTDSVLETRAVQVLRNAGLPEPVLQYPIDVGGGVTIHADLAYPAHNLLIETVGKGAHRSEIWQYNRDCRRLNAVNLLTQRYVVLHYTWDQVTKKPEVLVEEIAPVLGVPLQTCFRMLERRGGRPALYMPL